MPTQEQLGSAVKAACQQLVDKDRLLFQRNVNERSLSHKFALYLQHEVEKWNDGWEVDCEFNRDAYETGEDYTKRLNLVDKIDSLETNMLDEHAKTVYPDVIVHKRGPGNNLLVVEMKKDTAPAKDIKFDREQKLPAYVAQLGYQAAAFIMLRMADSSVTVEWFKYLD